MKQKTIKLKHGTATVDENCSPETIKALNDLADAAYGMDLKSIQKPKVKIEINKTANPNLPTKF